VQQQMFEVKHRRAPVSLTGMHPSPPQIDYGEEDADIQAADEVSFASLRGARSRLCHAAECRPPRRTQIPRNLNPHPPPTHALHAHPP